ncbi:hypothetical protein [Nannocystis radixulma]|uniref:Uncharacterized protein n=1 Tax=Nannocystis radixulma TaxID=2995305 RepID=A0ABT5BQE3_9BACT|nr:hypothetical protein [Nannocystis radixulma]MDC0675623.1 hypothetical protein [Nannocystis radixulma]
MKKKTAPQAAKPKATSAKKTAANAKKSATKATAANKPGAKKKTAKKPAANKPTAKPNTATTKRPKATRAARQLFMFSYHEHDWDEDAFKNSGKERLRRAQTGTWTAQRVPRSSWDNYCEVDSLAALRDQVRGFLVDQYHAPAKAAELPLAALRRMLDEDGWSFVGGRFLEFEGNHNDTTIYALLAQR